MRKLTLFLAVALALSGLAPVAADFLYPVTPPIKLYTDASGLPLENGYIYFGQPNQDPETNTKQMYWDAAGTIPAAQPIRTVAGYITRNGTPSNIFSTGDHSVTVKDRNGVLIFTAANSADLQLALNIAGVGAAAAVPIADAGGYYTTDNVESALQQIGGAGFVTRTRMSADALSGLTITGEVKSYCGSPASAPPTGYVWESGRTIGSASSGATERANADTSALYTLLWNSWDNTVLPIQDSAGTPTTRGASASNDFAANKRLTLPDGRGRVHAGLDFNNGGGNAALITAAGSGITGTTMGATGGTQTHTLVTGEMPSHTHTQDAHNHTQDAHNHTQNSHNHTQDAHNHTQNSHNHTQDAHNHTSTDSGHIHAVTDPGHFHTTTVPNATNAVTGGGGTFAYTATAGINSDNKVTGVTVDSASAVITVANGTATNQAATATNQATTATNQAATATNQATTATNQAATAVNQSTGGGGAHQNTQPTIVYSRIIKL